MKLYGITGRKDAGKTALVERLVAHFSGLGLRVATLKHAHAGFDIDVPGTDSHRHRMAGAAEVLVASNTRIAQITEIRDGSEPPLPALLARLGPADLILVEGWKQSPHPKIEVYRQGGGEPPLAGAEPSIRAVASDIDPGVPCPVLPLDDTGAIAAFIARELAL